MGLFIVSVRRAVIYIADVVEVVAAGADVHWRSTCSSYSRVDASKVDAGGTNKGAHSVKG